MARVNRKAKKILITGMILGAAAGILLTFLAANSKMHDKNDEIKTVKAKYEKERTEMMSKWSDFVFSVIYESNLIFFNETKKSRRACGKPVDLHVANSVAVWM